MQIWNWFIRLNLVNIRSNICKPSLIIDTNWIRVNLVGRLVKLGKCKLGGGGVWFCVILWWRNHWMSPEESVVGHRKILQEYYAVIISRCSIKKCSDTDVWLVFFNEMCLLFYQIAISLWVTKLKRVLNKQTT